MIALGNRVFSGCSRLESVSFASDSSIQCIGSNCFPLKCFVELPDTIYTIRSDSFGCDCEVHMKGENQDVIDEFEMWKETRDRCFVNPMREPNEIIEGALNLCEGGVIGSGGQGVVKVKLNMINGDILAVKVIDFSMFVVVPMGLKTQAR